MIYLLLFLEFFKIGLFTFGGGYAMIPLIKETVIYHEWIAEAEFYDFIGLCEATPGPIAVNMASFVGFSQAGVLGSILATLGVVLPSFIIIVLVASILKKFLERKGVKNFFTGVRPVVIGLITSTGFILLLKALGYQTLDTFNFSLVSLVICVVLVFLLIIYKLIFKKKMNNILFIVLSAVFGLLFSIIL